MKNKLSGGWIWASAVAIACLSGNSPARAQTVPDTAVALPADIAPDSPLAQVIKLVQASVDVGVIKNYIASAAGTFNLNAEKIIELNDLGVPSEVVNAMMDHDKNAAVAAATPAPAAAPAPTTVATYSTPAAPVNVQYFNETLSPYGSWVEAEGYGRVWRPTTVIYDPNWQPYCDRGHWVYSDCGWYWDSDYSWGVTFHYGRWFRNERLGWCWWPDTTWAPSWVTWRQSDAYCGWAPLPPFAVYRPGVGIAYRGANISVGFDFGLPVNCFTFVPAANFCDRHPRSFRADPRRGGEIFQQTTVINNYNDNRTTVINGGISVDRINAGSHRPIVPVNVGSLHNADRQGWRAPLATADHDSSGGQFRHGPALHDDHNNDANHRQNSDGQNSFPGHSENLGSTARPSTAETSGNRSQRDHDFNGRGNGPAASPQNTLPNVNNHPAPGTPFAGQPTAPANLPTGGNTSGNGNGRPDSSNHHNPPQPTASGNLTAVQNPPTVVNHQPAADTTIIRPQPWQGNRQGGGNQGTYSSNNRNPQPTQSDNHAGVQNTTATINHQPVAGTPIIRQQWQENRQPGGNERLQTFNNRNPQPTQFTPANTMPAAAPGGFRQVAIAPAPVAIAQPQHSIPQMEQRQVAMQIAPQREQRFEQRQPPVMSAPHMVAPVVQTQSQPHNVNQNPPQNSDKDKPRH